jgi:outer membrane protein assembly factor BamA
MHWQYQFRILALSISLLLISLSSDALALERRRDQFTKEPGYYIIPMPYSLPGIGKGLVVGGAYNNIADTHSDVIGFVIGGDLEGVGLLSLDNHIIPNRLILDLSAQHLTKAAVRSYNSRGMSSSADDYTILNLKDNDYYAARLTGTWWERRVEVYGGALDGRSHLEAIRDKDGNIIQTTSGAAQDSSTLFTLGVRLDWTDDYVDPRRGVRYQLSRWWANNDDPLTAEYYQIEHNLTGYIPVGKRSTWVFNYFQADAHVTRMGETDFATIEAQQGLNCSDPTLTAEQQLQCQQVINNIISNNTYGSVDSLGGWTRLRSYPDGRYKGAHALFLGTEFRWNLTEEFTPFDIWIARDIRTTIQLAFFYERGTIEDTKDKLGDVWRESYGVGVRIVTASGLVLRGDIATGNEGTEISVIVGYPWESF